MQIKRKNTIKRIVDILLTVLLLCLMAYQVTGEALHEWLGIGMTVFVIIHQALNAKWYGAVFRGKYRALRILRTAVNALLLLSFGMTALCGMSMSSHAVPFLYGLLPIAFARQFHLSLSHWSFLLTGLHVGFHVPMMTSKLSEKKKVIISSVFCTLAAAGLFFFLKNGIYNYLFFKVPFAFIDYEKAPALVFAENILSLTFFAFFAMQTAELFKGPNKSDKKPVLPALMIIISVAVGAALFAVT